MKHKLAVPTWLQSALLPDGHRTSFHIQICICINKILENGA